MTFTTSSKLMMETVAELVDELEAKDFDVHTITLTLNGQHGEFDVIVQATTQDMENVESTAIAHRHGGFIYGHPKTTVG